MKVVLPISLFVTALPSALAWGAAGHEIVATIAQIHLHPAIREKLCTVLPTEAKCHLAPVAAWADQVRSRYPASGPMHYINPKLDHPGDHCEFGEHGWINEDVNVLTAIMNKTQAVMDGEGDIPLRFLIHFMGDMHQPLHLTGRDKGGNGALFKFEGHTRNLHSVWDSGLITKNIREIHNYTRPVPSKQIESALLGAIFDPYVRWIVWEGIREWWRPSLSAWVSCPTNGDPYPHSSLDPSVPHHSSLQTHLYEASNLLLNYVPLSVHDWLTPYIPDTRGFADKLIESHPSRLSDSAQGLQQGMKEGKFEFPACPFTWASPLHQINCAIIWPSNYTGEPGHELIELDTDAYVGTLKREKTLEKLLAMAGIRLAKVLNEALGGDLSQGLKDELVDGLYIQY